MKQILASELPSEVSDDILAAANDIVQQIGGFIEYYEPNHGNTITMRWTGALPGNEQNTLVIEQRLNLHSGLSSAYISKAILKKYEDAKKVPDTIMNEAIDVQKLMDDIQTLKQSIEAFAKKNPSDLVLDQDMAEVRKLLDNYMRKEFPDSTPMDQGTYAEILKRILKEFKSYENAITKIENIVHSV